MTPAIAARQARNIVSRECVLAVQRSLAIGCIAPARYDAPSVADIMYRQPAPRCLLTLPHLGEKRIGYSLRGFGATLEHVLHDGSLSLALVNIVRCVPPCANQEERCICHQSHFDRDLLWLNEQLRLKFSCWVAQELVR